MFAVGGHCHAAFDLLYQADGNVIICNHRLTVQPVVTSRFRLTLVDVTDRPKYDLVRTGAPANFNAAPARLAAISSQ